MAKMTPEEAYDKAAALIAQAEQEGWIELDLSGMGLTEVPPEIGRLTSLQIIKLNHNRLTNIPDSLGNLAQLKQLNLGRNQLIAIPDSLGNLTQLKQLYLYSNSLSVIPDSLGNLTQLQQLALADNQLITIPDSLGKLTQLPALKLANNNLSVFPRSACVLTQLEDVDLGSNRIIAGPDPLGALNRLPSLNLGDNNLNVVPEWLKGFTKLRTLGLQGNQLKTIPEWLVRMPHLNELYIQDNPITQPPPEQLGEALTHFKLVDLEALRRYYAQLRREGQAYFYEAKLLLIGEGGAGKTSLARKLIDPTAPLPPSGESTEGIDILTWQFPVPAEVAHEPDTSGSQYQANIWDFGGQSVYHATHQFFLSKRSVYVLLADTRREHTDFYDWLRMQETFGEDSPILLLQNQNRQRGNQCIISRSKSTFQRDMNSQRKPQSQLNHFPQP